MKTRTPIRLVESLAECRAVGDVYHDRDAGGFHIVLPNDNAPTFWPYREPLENGACWTWNGDETTPTLRPSLHLQAGGTTEVPVFTIWHGWLTAGVLIEA